MFIYKITNIINNKMYVGQTTKSIEERFKQHVYTAKNNITNTYLSNAIRKYGEENFKIEVIDIADSQEELNLKETYWINYLNTMDMGYNMTDKAIGGNTYQKLSCEKMKKVKEKISESKKGNFNPNSKKIKCKNINTGEELFFNSIIDGQNYFKETNHNFITRRVQEKTKCLYKKQWVFAYQENDYPDYTIEKNIKRRKKIKVTNLETNETLIFDSISNAERYYKVKIKTFSSRLHKKGNNCIALKKFLLIVLN